MTKGEEPEVIADAEDQSSTEETTPELALLRFVLRERLPQGALGPESVPADVLALPIGIAIEQLVAHRKRCKAGPRCPHMPRSLLRYGRMRPQAIRQANEEVSRVLWTEPEHDLVEAVRTSVVDEHQDLVKELAEGRLLVGERLVEVLEELEPHGPVVLAAVIWASRFEGPNAHLLFRVLVALRDVAEPEGEAHATQDEVKKLKYDLRQARKEAREARASDEQAHGTIRQKEKQLVALRESGEQARAAEEAAAAQLKGLKERVASLERDLELAEKDGEQATRINSNLRSELQKRRKELSVLEVARSSLARSLGEESRKAEKLRLELEGQPSGMDLVWSVIQAEKTRIGDLRRISSGGDKERADDEWRKHRKVERALLEAHPEYTAPRPVAIRPKTPARFVALGGSAEVGKSCYLLEIGRHRILVDCGIQPSGSEDLHPEIDSIDSLNALVLTHAHTDHIGWVPALVRRFPEIEIYCSVGTAALLPVMLEDCRRHYVRKVTLHNERAKHIRNAAPIKEEYEQKDVDQVSRLAIACAYAEEEVLPFGDISLTFYRAGHILGASSVLVKDQSGRSVFFSGDFSSFPQLTLFPASWPEDLGEIDLLVLESTYGDCTHDPLDESRNKLIEFVGSTVGEREGSVLLAFALGRAQELLKLVAIGQSDGRIPPTAQVHIDGMIRSINPIYEDIVGLDLPDHYNEVTGETERVTIATHDAHRTPSIIVTTSGMLAGGPVVEYARHLLPHDRHRIVLTGYQDEGAPSQALRKITKTGGGPRIVKVLDHLGEEVEFEAALPAVEIGLSAHADQPGLLEYAARLEPRTIALVHGERRAQKALAKKLKTQHAGARIVAGPTELELS